MIENNERKEKMCLFFASDYHFEMISLPYINKQLNNNKEVIMMTENNLNESVNQLLSRINLKEEERNRIVKIDWKNNESNKFEEIKRAKEEEKDIIVFIKGERNYIKNINENIRKLNNKIEVVDCYDINEVQEDVSGIIKNYNGILSTSGIEKLL